MSKEKIVSIVYDPAAGIYAMHHEKLVALMHERLAGKTPLFVFKDGGHEFNPCKEYDDPNLRWRQFGLSIEDIVGQVVSVTRVNESDSKVEIGIRPWHKFGGLFDEQAEQRSFSVRSTNEPMGLAAATIACKTKVGSEFISDPVAVSFLYCIPEANRVPAPKISAIEPVECDVDLTDIVKVGVVNRVNLTEEKL